MVARAAWGVLAGVVLAGAAWAGMDRPLAMPAGGDYVSECGGCHTAYAPVLLPARSWRAVMAGLERHFGSDASLEPALRDGLESELVALALDAPGADPFVASRRMAATETPVRVTETPFFRFMHDEVPGHIWRRPSVASKANCVACHPRADQGRYFEREIKIPK